MNPKGTPESPTSLDFVDLLRKHPWLVERDLPCIISPDSDGILCGLLMANLLDWKVAGFYDGKVVIKRQDVKASECIFLDVEILREGVRSIGQHMLVYNFNKIPEGWPILDECISANGLRVFDYSHRFMEKYPFGTIHLLLAAVANKYPVQILEKAVAPLLYTDGTFKNLFNYPENCLSWIEFLGGTDMASPLHHIFLNDQYSLHEFMLALRDLFHEFHSLKNGRRGGDKIALSDGRGAPINILKEGGEILSDVRHSSERLLTLLSERTGWMYRENQWAWDHLETIVFSKIITKPLASEYLKAIQQKPLSLAITGREQLQFTVDTQKLFT